MGRAPSERAELVEQVARDNFRLLGRIHALAMPNWLDLDLSISQVKLLFTLAHNQPCPIGVLAQKLHVGLPAASHLTERLVQQGLAERFEDSSDRRRTLAQLTAAGADLVGRLRQGTRERFVGWIAELSDEDLLALSQGLQAVLTVASPPPAPTDPDATSAARAEE